MVNNSTNNTPKINISKEPIYGIWIQDNLPNKWRCGNYFQLELYNKLQAAYTKMGRKNTALPLSVDDDNPPSRKNNNVKKDPPKMIMKKDGETVFLSGWNNVEKRVQAIILPKHTGFKELANANKKRQNDMVKKKQNRIKEMEKKKQNRIKEMEKKRKNKMNNKLNKPPSSNVSPTVKPPVIVPNNNVEPKGGQYINYNNRTFKIRHGQRGGKYIMIGGNKKYI